MEKLQFLLYAIPAFVVVLSVVVFVHEYGHFRMARLLGVAAKSFSIGMGPELFGWNDKKGTRWKLSAVPIGGFVSWLDDTDPTSTAAPTDEYAQLPVEEARKRGFFRAQPTWVRALVVAAGPVTNFVFAILAFTVIALIFGRDVPRVDGMMANYPAEQAGLRPGDLIRAVDGQPTSTFQEAQFAIMNSNGRTLVLTVERAHHTFTTRLTPVMRDGRAVAGFYHTPDPARYERVGVLGALGGGVRQSWDLVASTGNYVGQIVAGRNSGRDIAGPLGILNASGQVAKSALPPGITPLDATWSLTFALLNFAAILSVAVGLVNLLPIPILDGGHLFFYAIEGVRGGRPLSPVAQDWAARAGLAVMACLFLFATWNDIHRMLPGAPG